VILSKTAIQQIGQGAGKDFVYGFDDADHED
jgi:hypothetical protein